jgi:hypothetical protein
MSAFKKIFFLCPLILCTFQSAFAGNIEAVRDTHLFSFKAKPKFFLTFDRTSSFVGGKAASTNELKLGMEFKKKLRLGIGIGELVSDVVAEKTIVAEQTGHDSTLNAELTLSFFSFNSEYVFYDSKRWQIAMPVGIGIGSSYFSYYDKVNGEYKKKRTDEGDVMIVAASGMATYRILRWVGFSAGLGYRFAVVNNANVKETFNSPVYVFKVRIFMGEIYKSVFPRGLCGKRNPPYSNEYWD